VQNKNEVLVISAEASSNLYAQRLLELSASEEAPIHYWGVGNQDMIDLGFEALGRAEDMAVMGFQEVLKHYPFIKGIYNNILEQVDKRQTKVALLMDYAEFNMKLAGELKKRGVKVLFYIAPQIWAWRQGRVKKLKASIEDLLCIFPFEEKFYQEHGVPTNFVGHPLLDEIEDKFFDLQERNIYRMQLGLTENQRVLALMPGSRKSEISLNFRTQLDTAKLLKKQDPSVAVVVLAAPGMNLDLLKEYVRSDDPEFLFIQDRPFRMLSVCDFALVSSGTATLVTGLMKKPMVVMYKMKPVSAWLAKKLVSKNNPYFAMVNLIFGKELMPEFFQEKANPKDLAKSISASWFDSSVYQNTLEELEKLPALLGKKGATKRVLDVLREKL
tara:strand:+ start:16306 stop:17460 length:1155 start_codon:yes stop_codon:yes gene_type:complete